MVVMVAKLMRRRGVVEIELGRRGILVGTSQVVVRRIRAMDPGRAEIFENWALPSKTVRCCVTLSMREPVAEAEKKGLHDKS